MGANGTTSFVGVQKGEECSEGIPSIIIPISVEKKRYNSLLSLSVDWEILLISRDPNSRQKSFGTSKVNLIARLTIMMNYSHMIE